VDVTSNANNAQNAGLPDDGAQIGPGLRLDGKAQVTIPASTTFNWAQGQALTWSAWINTAALQPNAALFSRREGGKDFVIGLDQGAPFVDIDGTRSQGSTPIQPKSWHHLAVVADGGKITIYVDGTANGSLSASIPALTGPALIGADAADATAGYIPFSGELDELEISNVARPSGYIRLEAMGQAQDTGPKLLSVSPDEQPPAGWLSGAFGLFGVILKSVTIDGWVVIGILGIMAVISWYVMITKFMYLNAVQKGNKLFLVEWKHLALDITAFDASNAEHVKGLGQRTGPKIQRLIRNSPLYRIYHVGADEIGKRISGDKILSSRSIQAIRASLDSSYVHENHTLNDGLVFLTISIAGGPFMGLLGTVVGVMITFAAIAATGEVNISAIAPGLAAALVATVAGLLVAIPALLGYNYLMSRLKTVTSDLQVFIDEFVTKMAEFYSNLGDS
jgi:biopolymer transport protein ExbB